MSCVNKKAKRERGRRRKCRWRRMFVINALKYHRERLSGWINKVIFPPPSIIRTEPTEADKFLNYENTKGRVDMFPRERKSTLIVSDWIWQAGDIRCVFDLRTISHNSRSQHTYAGGTYARDCQSRVFSLLAEQQSFNFVYIACIGNEAKTHVANYDVCARKRPQQKNHLFFAFSWEIRFIFAYDDD